MIPQVANQLINEQRLYALLLTGAVALLTGVIAVVIFFIKREFKRIDDAIAASVRRDELSQLRADMEKRHTEIIDRQDKRHAENTNRLERIETTATSTHRRIDELYRDLPKLLKG